MIVPRDIVETLETMDWLAGWPLVCCAFTLLSKMPARQRWNPSGFRTQTGDIWDRGSSHTFAGDLSATYPFGNHDQAAEEN